MIVATHDPSLLSRYRHRRLTLEKGRLVVNQPPDELPNTLRQMVSHVS